VDRCCTPGEGPLATVDVGLADDHGAGSGEARQRDMEKAYRTRAVDHNDVFVSDTAGSRAAQRAREGLCQRYRGGSVPSPKRSRLPWSTSRAAAERIRRSPVLGDADGPWLGTQVDLAPMTLATVATPVVGRHEDALSYAGRRPSPVSTTVPAISWPGMRPELPA